MGGCGGGIGMSLLVFCVEEDVKCSEDDLEVDVLGTDVVEVVWYRYIKNHKKTVKNRQARTRESVEYKAEARKVKPQSKSAKKSQRARKSIQELINKITRTNQSNQGNLLAHSHEEATSAMVKAQGEWVLALNTLT
ncbi:hypothetical protein Tco_1506678 [Tanacetum coccineum]